MKDNFIQLNKDDVLRLEIRTYDGKPTGEYLEFDLEDIELPLRLQEVMEDIKKNSVNLRNELIIIDKREDVKGKKMFSKNEEDKIKSLNNYYKKQVEAYNRFLGENGVQKLLNGRKIKWTTLQDVDEIIEKQIAPYLKNSMKKISDKVKQKYGNFEINPKDDVEVVQ